MIHVFASDAARCSIFDTFAYVTPARARAMQGAGCGGCVRYVKLSRGVTDDSSTNGGTLTRREFRGILATGLAVMLVQMAGDGSQIPTSARGTQRGENAAGNADELGYPHGATLWVDIESVHPDSTEQQVVDYVNAWALAVEAAGFEPGIYVGPGSKLTVERLYSALKLTRYWKSAARVAEVRGRGFCVVQGQSTRVPAGFPVDLNMVCIDGLGGKPNWAQPDNWINPHNPPARAGVWTRLRGWFARGSKKAVTDTAPPATTTP